jgi:protein-tyrosine-phosphatase
MGYPNSSFLIGRRGFGAGLVLFLAPRLATAAPCTPRQVLFVCPAGSVKSAIARETLISRAAERQIAVKVQSRGIHPEDHVSAELGAHLALDGLNPAREPLRALVADDVARADIIVAFDDAANAPGLERARRWDIPSWNADYAKAKAAMAPRIEALLTELGGCIAP